MALLEAGGSGAGGSYPTEAMITSTGSSSPLRAVTCMVTVSVRTRRERTRRSWPPRNTPGRQKEGVSSPQTVLPSTPKAPK